jgi:uncharacterized membrane protein
MVGEEFGWVPLDGLTITILLLEMIIIMVIPGFLLSLAVFPKRSAMSMSERLALSFGLGFTGSLVLYILNNAMNVPVNAVMSLLVFIGLCVIGFVGFLNRGGTINLIDWYKSKE